VSNFLPLNIFGWGEFRHITHIVNTKLRQMCREYPDFGRRWRREHQNHTRWHRAGARRYIRVRGRGR